MSWECEFEKVSRLLRDEREIKSGWFVMEWGIEERKGKERKGKERKGRKESKKQLRLWTASNHVSRDECDSQKIYTFQRVVLFLFSLATPTFVSVLQDWLAYTPPLLSSPSSFALLSFTPFISCLPFLSFLPSFFLLLLTALSASSSLPLLLPLALRISLPFPLLRHPPDLLPTNFFCSACCQTHHTLPLVSFFLTLTPRKWVT